MRTVITAVALTVLMGDLALAGAPGEIAYQGFLTEDHGPVDGNHDLEFAIYPDSTDGTALWQEGHQAVPVTLGVFKVFLGRHQPFPSDLFALPNRYLQTKIDGQVLAPRTRLAAVPYAFAAVRSDTAAFAQSGGGESVWHRNGQHIYYNDGNVGIGTTNPQSIFDIRGLFKVETSLGSPDRWALKIGDGTGWRAHISRDDGVPLVTFTDTGQVGINTTNPQAELEIRGGNANLKIAHWDGWPYLDLAQETGTHSTIKADFRSLSGGGNTGVLAAVEFERSPTANAGAIYLSTGADNSIARRVTVDSQGNVGIGTTTPTGKLHVAGDMCITGAKNAIVPTSRGMTKLYCDESTESWFSDRGEARIVDGRARVELDPLFLETVTISEPHPMKVWITYYGPHGNAYVVRGLTGFEVIDPDGGNAQFSWQVEAKRSGYVGARMEMVD
jgi:hypothetical protein